MGETITTALIFLINTLVDLYLFILILRLILVWVRADYYHPLVQFITKLTDFMVRPLRRLMPNQGRFEIASIFLIFSLALLKYLIILMITIGTPNFVGLIVLACANIIKLILNTFFYAILLQALLSWFQPYSPLNRVLLQLTTPLLRPFQRMIPPVSGVDISPIPVLILVQLLSIILVNPLYKIGFGLAAG